MNEKYPNITDKIIVTTFFLQYHHLPVLNNFSRLNLIEVNSRILLFPNYHVIYYARICQCGYITQIFCIPFRNFSENSAHNFT